MNNINDDASSEQVSAKNTSSSWVTPRPRWQPKAPGALYFTPLAKALRELKKTTESIVVQNIHVTASMPSAEVTENHSAVRKISGHASVLGRRVDNCLTYFPTHKTEEESKAPYPFSASGMKHLFTLKKACKEALEDCDHITDDGSEAVKALKKQLKPSIDSFLQAYDAAYPKHRRDITAA